LHLLRSINRNLFRIANLLKVAADGEEYGEEEDEVDESVVGVVQGCLGLSMGASPIFEVQLGASRSMEVVK